MKGKPLEENTIRSVKEITKKIERYKAQIEEWKEEDEKANEGAIFYYDNSIILLEYELKDAKALEYYNGNLGKAVKVMHKIDEITDDQEINDEEFSQLKQKVRHYIGKEKLDIQLRMQALETEMDEVHKLESIMSWKSADMWFYGVKEEIVGDN